jgi:hypothetical protein
MVDGRLWAHSISNTISNEINGVHGARNEGSATYSASKLSSVKRTKTEDLPTPESPVSSTLRPFSPMNDRLKLYKTPIRICFGVASLYRQKCTLLKRLMASGGGSNLSATHPSFLHPASSLLPEFLLSLKFSQLSTRAPTCVLAEVHSPSPGVCHPLIPCSPSWSPAVASPACSAWLRCCIIHDAGRQLSLMCVAPM